METFLTVTLFGSMAILFALDRLRPAREFPQMRLWRTRGLVGFAAYFALGATAPLLWDALLAEHRLVDATGLGPWLGAVVGILVVNFFSYWWHRALHRVPLLWRRLHQMHHSAERLDVYSAYWFHPLDALGFLFVGSLALVWAVGLSPEAALVTNTFGGICVLLQHTNIRTPRWLGYLVQRPENHAVHHERGVHAHNYGDIALWDIVFGTFRNPETWEGQAGFWDGASNRIGALLLGRDVSEPPQEPTTAPRELDLVA